ncbi:MAG: GNAT family protein [Pirellulaceae bacterium]
MRLHPIDDRLDLATLKIEDRQLVGGVVSSTRQMYESVRSVPPWIGYLAEVGGQIVGACGFKGPPTDGVVEIAYFTFPGYEDQGVATRMGKFLIEIARHANASICVIAQTLPERNASHRVLEKLHFTATGMKHHPTDGDVLEWSLGEHGSAPD